jgi:hypothetical protein
MEDRRIPKTLQTYNPKRRQSIGRPQLRWRDQHTRKEDGTDHEADDKFRKPPMQIRTVARFVKKLLPVSR